MPIPQENYTEKEFLSDDDVMDFKRNHDPGYEEIVKNKMRNSFERKVLRIISKKTTTISVLLFIIYLLISGIVLNIKLIINLF